MMSNKVYIIHESAIVQVGLAEILRRNFKCIVKEYYTFESFIVSEANYITKSILLTEHKIANSDKYLDFIDEAGNVKSLSIINNDQNFQKNTHSILLYSSPNQIYKQVKELLVEHEPDFRAEEGLTKREIDVLKLVALGFSNKEIADKLFISTHTVMSHRKNMTEKLGIKSISGLTVYAIINNHIDTTNLNIKDLI